MPLAGTNAAMSSPWPEAGPVAREHWEEDYECLLSAVGDLPVTPQILPLVSGSPVVGSSDPKSPPHAAPTTEVVDACHRPRF